MTTQKSSNVWLPIESNPDVMNKFLHNLGLPKKWAVTDVYGLDEPLLDMLPKPVVAMMLLFPLKKNAEEPKAEGGDNKEVYFMKQTISNACGTVAMIHSVANNLDKIELKDGFLKNFLNATADKTPDVRAEMLEKDDDVCATHDEVAQEGQTAAPNINDDVDYHFVAFVEKSGTLYELDGRKPGPINWGKSSAESFLQDAAKACKKYMERDPENMKFSILALAAASAE